MKSFILKYKWVVVFGLTPLFLFLDIISFSEITSLMRAASDTSVVVGVALLCLLIIANLLYLAFIAKILNKES